jgi:WD40 repeat protein
MEGHTSVVNSVAFSPDGTRVVSGSWDITLRLWDAVSGAHLATLDGHSNWVRSVAFSPVLCLDPMTRPFACGMQSAVYISPLYVDIPALSLRSHSPQMAPTAASGSSDTTIRLWDAVSGAHLATLSGHSNSVRSVAFSPDGTRIASGSYDSVLRVWDTVSHRHLDTVRGRAMCASSLARSLSSSWTSFSQSGTIPSSSIHSIFRYLTKDG